MRKRILVSAAGALLVASGIVGGLLVADYTDTASAKDPDPAEGMHQVCEKMNHEGMAEMHEAMNGMHQADDGMHGDSGNMDPGGTDGQMHQGMDGMHGDASDGDQHMGQPANTDDDPVD